jgi:hypothetical protein
VVGCSANAALRDVTSYLGIVCGGWRSTAVSCWTTATAGCVAVTDMMRNSFRFTHQDKQKPRLASSEARLRGAYCSNGRLPLAHRSRLTTLSKPP